METTLGIHPSPKYDVQYYPNFIEDKAATNIFLHMTEIMDTENHIIPLLNGEDFETQTGKCLFLDPILWSKSCFLEIHGAKIPWPKPLLKIKQEIERITGRKFDVGSVTYYKNGKRAVDYHYDYPYYGVIDYIPSLSFGAERTFSLRDTEDPSEILNIQLNNGSLLIMGEGCQTQYEHALLPDTSIKNPRINITFWQLDS